MMIVMVLVACVWVVTVLFCALLWLTGTGGTQAS
jgi:hypothetical protein